MASNSFQTSGEERRHLEQGSVGTPGIQSTFRKAFTEKYKEARSEFLNQRLNDASQTLEENQAALEGYLEHLREKREGRKAARIPTTVFGDDGASGRSVGGEGKNVEGGVGGGASGDQGGAGGDSAASSKPWQLPRVENVRYKIGKGGMAVTRAYKGFKIPRATTIPAYTAWVYVPKNEQDQDNDRRMFYTDDIGETVPASDEEVEYEFWYWNGKDIQWRNFVLEKMAADFGESRELYEALADKLKVDADAIETRYREMAAGRTDEVVVDRVNGKMEDGRLAFQQAFCRRCGVYECRLHGGLHVMPNKAQDRLPSPPNETPCGANCYLLQVDDRGEPCGTQNESQDAIGQNQSGSITGAVQQGSDEGRNGLKWTSVEIGFVSQGVLMFGPNPCEISRLFGNKTCKDVHLYLKDNASLLKLRHPQQKSHRKKQMRRKTFNNRKGPLVVQKRFRHNEAELWHSYTPCNCKNACTNSCSCYQTKNFCEKYCGCYPGCNNVWKGCKCSHRCDTQRCPCVSASRECDPDYCGLCKKTCEPGCDPEDQCKNMNLRLRKHKRVAMGLSTVAGWGGFLMEPARKDDFLGEYTGDLITDQEAERRGRIYDRQDKSYLFNLTKEKVLDANRRGNKLRFANHSKDPNCYVKYMLVDGDHRVGIFAGKDIGPGEEIFYDYGGAWCSKWYDPEAGKN